MRSWCGSRTLIGDSSVYALILAALIAAAPPQQSGPQGIPPTGTEIELGRKLFFEPLLSVDGTVSCASCHNPSKGWADGLPLAVGINGQVGTRHSPTIINASYSPLMFWDGRTVAPITQALLPLSNPIEMGRQSEDDVVRKLRLLPEYVSDFARVYGVDTTSLSPVTGVRLARAIAAFETTIVSFNAPIDRRLDGDVTALTPDAEIGFQLFRQANCMSCHTPPLFTDNLMHNNGMEYAGKLQVSDLGRAGILPQNQRTAQNIRAFKTPHLREIHRTAPYNHAGNFADLDRVILHYATGGARYDDTFDRFIDPRVRAIRTLGWTAEQRGYLRTFILESFKGSPSP
ncbi:MAG: cytochrome-c peroxidase [Pirellula sp.]|nr:cytochrome-c peroxidase [Pirellula sp.]